MKEKKCNKGNIIELKKAKETQELLLTLRTVPFALLGNPFASALVKHSSIRVRRLTVPVAELFLIMIDGASCGCVCMGEGGGGGQR